METCNCTKIRMCQPYKFFERMKKKRMKKNATVLDLEPFKRQPHKMVNHTKTIHRLLPDELFECVWPFCGVGA